jgi:predicted O-methyltransferase YrrM
VQQLRAALDKAFALSRSGSELPDRIGNRVNAWTDRRSAPGRLQDVKDPDEMRTALRSLLGGTMRNEINTDTLFDRLECSQRSLAEGDAPFQFSHNGTATFAMLCYLVCRFLRPRLVVETGVAYGVTSSSILQALEENGHGELHSIDLPPLGRDAQKYVGYFVPPDLRTRWKLRIGSAKKLLPEILRQAHPIDMFVHDSLHTYSHMKWEFESALAALRPGGVLISDDIEGNRAFEEILQRGEVDTWFAIRQEGKEALCGAIRTKA